MTTLVTSDLHWTDNARDAYRHEFAGTLRRLVIKHAADCCVILGDLTEEKDHHSARLVNAVCDHLADLAQQCEVVILRGNHDYADIASPYWQFLDHIENITWVNEPGAVDAAGLNRDFPNALFLPHTTTWERDWKKVPLLEHRHVFAHQTFDGASSDGGFQLSGIPGDIFADDAHVICGDIHTPQFMKYDNGAVIEYVGSPYLVDFGDSFQPRVLKIVDEKVTSIKLKGRQKRLLKITSLAELEQGSTTVRNVNEGDIVKVEMLVTGETKSDWPNLKEKIREWSEDAGVELWQATPKLLDTLRPKAKQEPRHIKNDEELVKAYVKKHSRDKLHEKVGLQIARKV